MFMAPDIYVPDDHFEFKHALSHYDKTSGWRKAEIQGLEEILKAVYGITPWWRTSGKNSEEHQTGRLDGGPH